MNTKRTQEAKRKLFRIWGPYCIICGKEIKIFSTGKNSMTVEHIIPISKGGDSTLDNLALAHEKCNNKKNDGSLIKAMQKYK